jgi:predicted ATPase
VALVQVRPVMLLDRLAERAALGRVLDAARAGQSGVLVVRGLPGIGKTARPRSARR